MELPDYGGTDGIICVEKDLIGQDTYAKVQTDIYSILTESFQVSEDSWNSDVSFRVTGNHKRFFFSSTHRYNYFKVVSLAMIKLLQKYEKLYKKNIQT